MKEKISFNYIYKITNTINGKIYIGVHKTTNLNDGYMGSGHALHRAYEKYGIEHFKKDILEYFDTWEDALQREAEIVDEEFVKREDTYNMRLGGPFGVGKLVCFVPVLDSLNNGYKIISKDEYWNNRDKYKTFLHNKVTVKDSEGNAFMVDKNDPRYISGELTDYWKGKKHSEETLIKMRNVQQRVNRNKDKNPNYGHIWIYNDELKQNKIIHKDDLEKYINEGWIKGRKAIYYKCNQIKPVSSNG